MFLLGKGKILHPEDQKKKKLCLMQCKGFLSVFFYNKKKAAQKFLHYEENNLKSPDLENGFHQVTKI
jgi:hypothetical protein